MSTAYRIDKGKHQPQKGKPRNGRTREDPFSQVWESELVPLLEANPGLKPTTLFEYLQEKYPDQYDRSKLRTLQRRVQQWKAIAGPPKEVMFCQKHEPGKMGLSDFTHFQKATITIGGQPFKHLLYHYRLSYSGWQYVQVIQGGESFVALSEGVQNALERCGGAPEIHRTDSLSASYKNLNRRGKEDLTQRYEELCRHYSMNPTRNNRGKSHENGAIESPHGHFKNRLSQALLLRNSHDFDSVEDYQKFVEKVVDGLNRQCQSKFAAEKLCLQPLPTHKYADYEAISVKVTCFSTITVRCILYTVPSQLIGQRLTIHLYHDRLIGYLGSVAVVELDRIYVPSNSDKRRARCVNYRHVIDSLRKKPRAFLQYRWRDDLLPNDYYRQLWKQMLERFDPYQASRLMVEGLYFAALLDKESTVGYWMNGELKKGSLTLVALQQQFAPLPLKPIDTHWVQQHPLSSYDKLLHHDYPSNCSRGSSHSAEVSTPVSHDEAMAVP